MHSIAEAALPPSAYTGQPFYEAEKAALRRYWQWAGLIEDTEKPGGLVANIAEVPVGVERTAGSLTVSVAIGARRNPLKGAVAEVIGRFVFVRLEAGSGPSLSEFLGNYVGVLRHASENFQDVFDAAAVIWSCNWKAGLEITLEGYHVPAVHNYKSKFDEAVPYSTPAVFEGPHSHTSGIMSDGIRTEMTNIAKRLKISQSTIYTNYDHFTLFPNMTIGFSGGCLAFIQIYSPLGPDQCELRYAYIVARQTDPAQKPVPIIKKTLLGTWREYTEIVLDEDKVACEAFQRGVRHATRTGVLGQAEARVIHFQRHWREAVAAAELEAI